MKNYIENTMFMYMDKEIMLILDKNININSIKEISFNKKYFTFVFKDKTKEILIPKINLIKDLIKIEDIYVIDQINLLSSIYIIKKSGQYF